MNNLTAQQVAICDYIYNYDNVKSASELPQVAADRLVEKLNPDQRAAALAALAAVPAPAPIADQAEAAEAPKRTRKKKGTPLDDEE